MAREFVAGYKGITMHLDDDERRLLTRLFSDILSMLDAEDEADTDPLAALVGLNMNAQRPADPALARLLPDAHKNDAEASLEFRRYTERGIRESKAGYVRQAQLLVDSGATVLDAQQAESLSKAMNDVRLVLGVRLNINDEAEGERVQNQAGWEAGEDDLESAMGVVYTLLSHLQESLTLAMLQNLRQEQNPEARA